MTEQEGTSDLTMSYPTKNVPNCGKKTKKGGGDLLKKLISQQFKMLTILRLGGSES